MTKPLTREQISLYAAQAEEKAKEVLEVLAYEQRKESIADQLYYQRVKIFAGLYHTDIHRRFGELPDNQKMPFYMLAEARLQKEKLDAKQYGWNK